MAIHWGMFWRRSRKPLQTCWLITAGIVVLYMGFIHPRERERGIAQSKAAALASLAGEGWEPKSHWWRALIVPRIAPLRSINQGVVGGVPGRVLRNVAMMTDISGGERGEDEGLAADRKLIRTATLSLIVKSPSESAERIVQLAQSAGGSLLNSQVSGGSDAPSASLSIRVPAAKFEDIHAQIRKLAVRVESQSVEAQDVTKQYVDQEARLRNLRAEEQQYLDFLRKAITMKDTLEVSDKLNEVRGAIEERLAEFETLSKRVETVAIDITLRAEANTQVFGLHWRPLYQLKIAAREGLDGLGDYAASMTLFALYLPTIVLWLLTVLAGAAIGLRILRWAARILFRSPRVNLPGGAVAP